MPADRSRGLTLRLLVIEDEDRLSGILKSKLGEIGFAVDIAGFGGRCQRRA
jgi:DNA-binding response OmpR family regulator